MDAHPTGRDLRAGEAVGPNEPVPFDEVITKLLRILAERRPDPSERNGDSLRSNS